MERPAPLAFAAVMTVVVALLSPMVYCAAQRAERRMAPAAIALNSTVSAAASDPSDALAARPVECNDPRPEECDDSDGSVSCLAAKAVAGWPARGDCSSSAGR